MLRTELISFLKTNTGMKGLDKYPKKDLEQLYMRWLSRNDKELLLAKYPDEVRRALAGKIISYDENEFVADIDCRCFEAKIESHFHEQIKNAETKDEIKALMNEYQRLKLAYLEDKHFHHTFHFIRTQGFGKISEYVDTPDYIYKSDKLIVKVKLLPDMDWITLTSYKDEHLYGLFDCNFKWTNKHTQIENIFYRNEEDFI